MIQLEQPHLGMGWPSFQTSTDSFATVGVCFFTKEKGPMEMLKTRTLYTATELDAKDVISLWKAEVFIRLTEEAAEEIGIEPAGLFTVKSVDAEEEPKFIVIQSLLKPDENLVYLTEIEQLSIINLNVDRD